MAYADLEHNEIAERMGDLVSKRTLERWAKQGIPLRMKHAGQAMRRLAAVAGLPEAFFYVDLQRLPELLPSEGSSVTPHATDVEAAAEARRAAERLDGPPSEERRQGRPDRRTG